MSKPDGRVWSLKIKHLPMVQRIQRRMPEKCSKSPTAQNDLELMKENHRLREDLAEAKKENLFLKKAAAFRPHGS